MLSNSSLGDNVNELLNRESVFSIDMYLIDSADSDIDVSVENMNIRGKLC